MAIQRAHPRVDVRRFGPIRLWRDELSELVDVIRQVHPASVLEVDGYTCDEVSDLAELKDPRISRFSLTSDDNLVSLLLDRDAAQISAVEADMATRGMLGEVERIARLHERESARAVLVTLVFTTIAAFVGVGLAALTDGEEGLHGWPALAVGVLLTVGLTVPVVVALRRGARPRVMAIVYTRTRAEAPTWFQRNRDGLVANAIVSAIFFVIGLLVGQAT